MRRRALLAATLAAPGIARAQHVSAWAAVFDGWASQNGVQHGSVAAMRSGRLVHASGFGAQPAAARAPMWSLSKFITGATVARLIGDGRVRLDTTLGSAMPAVFARHGVAADGPLGRLTVAELLCHRTGLPTRIAGEAVPGLARRVRQVPPERIGIDDLAPTLLALEPAAAPGARFEYANANFLLLGMMVAAISREPYSRFAGNRVLAPAGINNPMLDPQWRVLDGTGGWRLSAPEYLAMARHVLTTPEGLPPEIRRWRADAAGKGTGNGPVHYALGLIARTVSQGQNIWHTGSWSWRSQATYGAVETSGGSLFVMAPDATAWCCTFRPLPSETARAALDTALWQAARTAANESATDLFPAMLRAAS